MSTPFAALSADNVGADIKALLHMFGMSDHIHIEDTRFVKALDDIFGGNADGRDKELGARVDDDGYQLVQLTFGIIVARNGDFFRS